MEVRFDSLDSSPVTALFEYALQFYARELHVDDHRPITLRVTTLDNMCLDESTGLPAAEGGDIWGAVYFPETVCDTAEMTEFHFGFWYGCTPGELFQVMAHEMVHIWQYASGTLRSVRTADNMINHWEGQVMDDSELEYMDMPWEIHAYAHQDHLLEKLVADDTFLQMAADLVESRAENNQKLV